MSLDEYNRKHRGRVFSPQLMAMSKNLTRNLQSPNTSDIITINEGLVPRKSQRTEKVSFCKYADGRTPQDSIMTGVAVSPKSRDRIIYNEDTTFETTG